MKKLLLSTFIICIMPALGNAQLQDTIKQSDFKGDFSEYNKPYYKHNDGELDKKESKRHSLLVYGAAYLHDSLRITVDAHNITDVSEMVEEDFVYLVVDTMTNTFYWVDSGFEDTHERNTMFGSCRIEGDILYLKAEYSSRTIHENDRKTTVFNDSIGLLHAGGLLDAGNYLYQSNKKRIKEYKFIIANNQLRNVTEYYLPWEMPYQDWKNKIKMFDNGNKKLPGNIHNQMFHSEYEPSFYPKVLYRIDLGEKFRRVTNDFIIVM